MSTPPSASARATPRARSSASSWRATAPDAAAALTPELIDHSAVCCRPRELDERLAAFDRAGATTLLAMPFGDRPAIVEQLASAVAA
jgi:hypothetical protein